MSEGGRYRRRCWAGVARTVGLALVIGAGLALTGSAAAKARQHRLRCRAGYVRRTVRVPVRHHGRIVRRNHKIVYVRVQRCVRKSHPKGSSAPAPVKQPTTITSPSTPTTPTTPSLPPPPAPTPAPSDAVAVAVGDIARPPSSSCSTTSNCPYRATEALTRSFNPNDVFVLGDNQYNSGALSEYEGQNAYNATWGVFNPIVHPVPGNHEYSTTGASGYFSYFGQAIANPDNTPYGYYSVNVGTWHIVALNSNCSNSDVGKSGCPDALAGSTTSAQTAWLQSDLAANRSACVLAMWHHPLFSDGWTGGSPGVLPLYSALYNAHADIVLNGHDHLYERYGQMDPSGNATASGIREFVVGTGGESLNGLGSTGINPQVSDSQYGVLVLSLQTSSYSWKFVNTAGVTVDSGTTACHGPGAPAAVAAVAHVARSTRTARLNGPALAFDVHPLGASVRSMMRSGVPVAVHSDRGIDVTVTIWLRRGGRLQRIASAYETESQISKPYSRILVRLPERSLAHAAGGALVMRFAAVDAAGHRRTVMRTVRLR